MTYGVSAFFPCYNDAETIGKMVGDVDTALAASPLVDDYEMIVVERRITRRLRRRARRTHASVTRS